MNKMIISMLFVRCVVVASHPFVHCTTPGSAFSLIWKYEVGGRSMVGGPALSTHPTQLIYSQNAQDLCAQIHRE